MKFILVFLIIMLIYSIGVLVGYLSQCLKVEKIQGILKEKEINLNKEVASTEFYKKELQNANLKITKIDALIRNSRNELINKQTELRKTPSEKQNNKALDYIGVNANVRLITKLEEAIRNEM